MTEGKSYVPLRETVQVEPVAATINDKGEVCFDVKFEGIVTRPEKRAFLKDNIASVCVKAERVQWRPGHEPKDGGDHASGS